ncbi:MAG: shikimate kinase [Oscillospiraceae bacterium]
MFNNIVLIGMPASGKSTIGVILAKVLKCRFVDTDLIMQDSTDKTLIDIISEKGMDGFIEFENDTVSKLKFRNTVIATGGSVVYGEQAMANLKKDGIVVYLKHRYEVIDSRLTNISTRGVVMHDGQTLQDLFNERVPLYEKYADITIEADGLSTEQTVEKISEIINNMS